MILTDLAAVRYCEGLSPSGGHRENDISVKPLFMEYRCPSTCADAVRHSLFITVINLEWHNWLYY